MPFTGDHANDIGLELPEGPVCKFDSENGQVKNADTIFAGGVEWFSTLVNGDRKLAERLTRKNMRMLPYWKAHPFPMLDGEEATEQEFADAMAKM